MLGAAEGKTVRCASADIKGGKALADTLGNVRCSTGLALRLAYRISRAVTGKDQRGRLALIRIGIGKTENGFALGKLLAVKDLVCRRSRNVAEIVEFDLEKYSFHYSSSKSLTAPSARNLIFASLKTVSCFVWILSI